MTGKSHSVNNNNNNNDIQPQHNNGKKEVLALGRSTSVVEESALKRVNSVVFRGPVEKAKPLELRDVVDGNIKKFDNQKKILSLRVKITQLIQTKQVMLLPLTIDTVGEDKDPGIEKKDLAEFNARIAPQEINKHFGLFTSEAIKELCNVDILPLWLMVPAKYYHDPRKEGRKDTHTVSTLPIVMDSAGPNEVSDFGVYSTSEKLKPLMHEAGRTLEALRDIVKYHLTYLDDFVEPVLDKEALKRLSEEASEAYTISNKANTALVVKREQEKLENNNLSRNQKRKEEKNLKKKKESAKGRVVEVHQTMDNVLAKGEVQRSLIRLRNAIDKTIYALENMRPCAMNIYYVYLSLSGMGHGPSFIKDMNPYFFRMLVRVNLPFYIAIRNVTQNLSRIAQIAYEIIGGKTAVLEKSEKAIFDPDALEVGASVVEKKWEEAHVAMRRREQEKLEVSQNKDSQPKKGKNNRHSKQNKKQIKVKPVQEQEKTVEIIETKPVSTLPEVKPSSGKEEVVESFVEETSYPRAKKEKVITLSKKEQMLQEIEQERAKEVQAVIKEFAHKHQDTRRMLVSAGEFTQIFQALSPKNQRTHSNIMGAVHHECTNDDIEELVNALAFILDELLGGSVAEEVRKIKPHAAHRSGDTGNLQPANFLKILRPRFVLLGLFDQKHWKPVAAMDHSVYKKYLTQKLHGTLQQKGIYTEKEVAEYLAVNPELLDLIK